MTFLERFVIIFFFSKNSPGLEIAHLALNYFSSFFHDHTNCIRVSNITFSQPLSRFPEYVLWNIWNKEHISINKDLVADQYCERREHFSERVTDRNHLLL